MLGKKYWKFTHEQKNPCDLKWTTLPTCMKRKKENSYNVGVVVNLKIFKIRKKCLKMFQIMNGTWVLFLMHKYTLEFGIFVFNEKDNVNSEWKNIGRVGIYFSWLWYWTIVEVLWRFSRILCLSSSIFAKQLNYWEY